MKQFADLQGFIRVEWNRPICLSGKERGLKTSKNCHGSMPPDPLILEACAFGDRLGNRSVFILDPRFGIFHKALKHVAIW